MPSSSAHAGIEPLARLAAHAVRVPVAFIALSRGGGIVLATAHGLAGLKTGDTIPAGSLTERVLAGQELVCPDLRKEAAFASSWEVAHLGARALLGLPLSTPEGVVIGAFVAVDLRVRAFTEQDVKAARDVAAVAGGVLEVARAVEDGSLALARAHVAFTSQEERYLALLAVSPDPVIIQREGSLVFANAAFVHLVGARSASDVLGKSVTEFLQLPYLKAVREMILGHAQSQEVPRVVEEELRRLDGSVVAVEVAAAPCLYEGTAAVQMFLRDLTERHRAEAALRESEMRIRLMLDQTPVILWATDTDLRIGSVLGGTRNDLARRLYTGIGREVGASLGGEAAPRVVEAHRRALAGESAMASIDWGGRSFEVRIEPLRDAHGAVDGAVGIALDLTERKAAEDGARDTQLLEGLGRVAGGVAHEMNNMLATVMGLGSVLESDTTLPPSVHRDVEAIMEASRRGRELVANLLAFARTGRRLHVRFHLNDIAREVASWVRANAQDVEVTLHLDPVRPMVEGDPDQVRGALRNVCRNAIEAMPRGGRLDVVTRGSESGSDVPELPPGRYASVEVRDTGPGMTEEVRRRAIEPFFTTKAVGEGPGLGLSMAYGVARSHGGDLSITSASGAGTAVFMYFPARELTQPEVHPPPPAGTRARATSVEPAVLVVDDDDWVRFSSRRMLERLGYRVDAAEDGASALKRFQERGGRYDFVLLDLRMPGVPGEEVLRELVRLDPEVRVIIFTGFDRDQVSQSLFELGHVGFLAKPSSAEELLQQVRALGMRRERSPEKV